MATDTNAQTFQKSMAQEVEKQLYPIKEDLSLLKSLSEKLESLSEKLTQLEKQNKERSNDVKLIDRLNAMQKEFKQLKDTIDIIFKAQVAAAQSRKTTRLWATGALTISEQYADFQQSVLENRMVDA